MAFAIVEGSAELDGGPFTVVGGAPPVRFVPSSRFRSQSGADHPEWLSMLDDDHIEEPPGGGVRAGDEGAGAVRPQDTAMPLAQWPPGRRRSDPVLGRFIRFDGTASSRNLAHVPNSARRAGSLDLPALVKLRYEDTASGSGEHLWFEVHDTREDSLDATLINQPFGEIGIAQGERGTHELERLSDWSILSPLGMVTPRSTRLLRALREHREELIEALRRRSAPRTSERFFRDGPTKIGSPHMFVGALFERGVDGGAEIILERATRTHGGAALPCTRSRRAPRLPRPACSRSS